jgi:protein gp37
MEPSQWAEEAEKAGERHRVFCASLADVFDDEVPDVWRSALWSLIIWTRSLDWLTVTKRPAVMEREVEKLGTIPNMWLGVSIENQKRARERIPILAEMEAPVRFLSCEPLLGPVDLSPWLHRLDWVIAGGESGPYARPVDPKWARSLRDQCVEAGVKFHFKQWGGGNKKAAGRELDGRTWDEVPMARNIDPDGSRLRNLENLHIFNEEMLGAFDTPEDVRR